MRENGTLTYIQSNRYVSCSNSDSQEIKLIFNVDLSFVMKDFIHTLQVIYCDNIYISLFFFPEIPWKFCLFHFFCEEQRLEVYGHNISSNAIKVFWNSVSLDFLGFIVRYWAITDGEVTAVLRQVTKTTNSIQLEGLEAFTVYVVQVKVIGMNGTAGHIWGQAKISTDEAGMLMCTNGIWSLPDSKFAPTSKISPHAI